jgi:outer membrane protein TolC
MPSVVFDARPGAARAISGWIVVDRHSLEGGPVERSKRIGWATGWIVGLALVWGPSAGWAQARQPPRRQSDRDRGPEALPDRGPAGDPSRDIIPPPPTPPSILAQELRPIDLLTALQLANVQNPELNIARRRILEAAALRQLAAAYFLPSINPGLNYDSHTGTLQQSNGNILSVDRSAVYVGAGANAIAAGTVSIPGVYYAGNVGYGLYLYLASKQVVRQREFESVAVRNQMFLQVTTAYSELLRAEGRRAASIQARDEAREIARLTAEYARAGQGRVADANRAATVLATWESRIQATEAELLTASARLCQLLNLDPSIRLHPTDAVVIPQPIVPDPIPLCELIALGLLRRPELAAQRAAIEAALLNLGGAKVLPFSPNFLLGFSAGGFGGGSNLVRPIFGGFGGREDFDVVVFWTLQNLGLGNLALIRVADARLQINQFQQVELLNMVRAEIAEAYARTHARYAQIGTYEEAVRSGYMSFHEDLDRTRLVGAARPRDVLPIELLNSFLLLADARLDYLDAIVDYNESQFAMYVALGQPPADALAHPVPTEGITPHNLPPGAPPPGQLSPLPIPATPEASQRSAPAAAAPAPPAPPRSAAAPPRDTVQPVGFRPSIPSP